jgi:NAD-dependent dihydropyrimidine dehydrogenase PreA subunit
MVSIDSNKCNGCGSCVEVCPQGAITIDNDVAVVNPGLCVQCGVCLEICPVGAIRQVAPVYAESGKGGDRMTYGRGWFGWGRGGYGRGGGWGFGFRGASPPWPYVGRGRGGLPRCWYPGLFTTPTSVSYGGYPGWGVTAYPTQVTKEQETDFLKEEANAIKSQLKDIEARIKELEAK